MHATQEDIFDILRMVRCFPSVNGMKTDFSTEEDYQKGHSTTREDSGAPWIFGAPRPCGGSDRLV